MHEERREMLGNILRSHRLSALIFWRPDELVMTLGYMPLWGVSVLVYTADHEPVLFVPEPEPEDILPQGITIKTFPWGVITCADPWAVLYGEIKEALRKKRLGDKPVAFIKNIGGTAPCRMSGEQPPLPGDLTERLPGVSTAGFSEITEDLIRLYRYKTDADIKGLQLAQEVAAAATGVFYKEAKEEITESKLAALIECAVQEMTGQNGISFARAWPMIQSGRNTADGGKYNRSTGRIIATGEPVMLEMGICANGYWADITRTAVTGEISDVQRRMFDTVKGAQQTAIRMLKPGVVMGDVDAASRKYIEDAGFGAYFNHALGHQVGFRYHDPGARLSPDCADVLEKGMVLTVEPGIYGAELNGGIRIEDNVLITADGCLVLSDYPRSLKGDRNPGIE